MNSKIQIGDRQIGQNFPCYLIAEIGVNHNGDLQIAHQLIDAAAKAGADAVKFQTYITDELVIEGAAKADYQKDEGDLQSQTDMLRALELPFEAFIELKEHCKKVNLDFLSTAFDPESLEFVISLRPACLKWASGELTNMPLLKMASKSELPMLLSTGMGSDAEIRRAVDWLGADIPKVILQCVSDYPAKIEDQNLKVLPMLQETFGCPVGFSDHTIGPYAAIAARALGMSVLEKHFTLDCNMKGPDHRASIEPAGFAEMASLIRSIEVGLGDGKKAPRDSERNIRTVARKSLVFRSAFEQGHIIGEADITAKRPGIGISPDKFDSFVGRKLNQAVGRDQLVEHDHVEN